MRHQHFQRSADAAAENAFLTRLRTLTALEPADIDAVAATLEGTRHIRSRAEFVSSEPRRPERLHVLIDGWAGRARLLADGRRQITALLIPGDLCDLGGLYARNGGFAATTLTPCVVATIDAQKLRDLAAERPRVAEALGWLAAVENAMLAERNASLGRRSAREHLAHLICELLVRTAVVGHAQDLGFLMRITQEEIADVLGLTAVHVNRVLQGLRAEGLIEQRGSAVTILDWNGLKQAAGFRTDYLHLEGLDGAAQDMDRAPWSLAIEARRAP